MRGAAAWVCVRLRVGVRTAGCVRLRPPLPWAQADVAVALQPLPAWRCSWVGLDPRPRQPRRREPRGGGGGAVGGRWAGRAEGMAAAPLLDTLHCAGVLPADHDLEQLTEWLLQGRSLLNNTKQALAFGLWSSLLLMLLQLGAAWAGLPPPLATAHLLWLLLLVVPVLALPLLLASIDPRNKKEMVTRTLTLTPTPTPTLTLTQVPNPNPGPSP